MALIADAGVLRRGAPAAPADDWDLRVFALSRASQRLLRLCGTWQRLPAARCIPTSACACGTRAARPGGAGSLTFDCAEIGEPNLGFIVEGRALQARACKSVGAAGAVLIEAAVQTLRVDENEARIRLEDGRESPQSC